MLTEAFHESLHQQDNSTAVNQEHQKKKTFFFIFLNHLENHEVARECTKNQVDEINSCKIMQICNQRG